MICALGYGLYERDGEDEKISEQIMYGLSIASGDAYIVVPPALQGKPALSIPQVERLVGAVLRMLASGDNAVRNRAAVVIAATTNSWPTMNPSALDQRKHGTSLLAVDQVRRWLLHVLKQSRPRHQEATALVILDKLRTADFRDLYPQIQSEFKLLSCSNAVSRVRTVFDTLQDFYPAHSPLVNERCELLAYEHYVNRTRGAGAILERLYGPLLKYSVTLAKMFKKGTWLTSHARYEEWFYGEGEPN
jgi:hypothetical protein